MIPEIFKECYSCRGIPVRQARDFWTNEGLMMVDGNKELKKAGLKVTLPRVKILEILEGLGISI